eukprot:GHVT01088856.1.p1 GENE.GHVT01088856.1~~GHVT01088856.1.p1  ORF type:complete len:932 (-),score=72.79 GHVT01088856.1:1436-4231(-)
MKTFSKMPHVAYPGKLVASTTRILRLLWWGVFVASLWWLGIRASFSSYMTPSHGLLGVVAEPVPRGGDSANEGDSEFNVADAKYKLPPRLLPVQPEDSYPAEDVQFELVPDPSLTANNRKGKTTYKASVEPQVFVLKPLDGEDDQPKRKPTGVCDLVIAIPGSAYPSLRLDEYSISPQRELLRWYQAEIEHEGIVDKVYQYIPFLDSTALMASFREKSRRKISSGTLHMAALYAEASLKVMEMAASDKDCRHVRLHMTGSCHAGVWIRALLAADSSVWSSADSKRYYKPIRRFHELLAGVDNVIVPLKESAPCTSRTPVKQSNNSRSMSENVPQSILEGSLRKGTHQQQTDPPTDLNSPTTYVTAAPSTFPPPYTQVDVTMLQPAGEAAEYFESVRRGLVSTSPPPVNDHSRNTAAPEQDPTDAEVPLKLNAPPAEIIVPTVSDERESTHDELADGGVRRRLQQESEAGIEPLAPKVTKSSALKLQRSQHWNNSRGPSGSMSELDMFPALVTQDGSTVEGTQGGESLLMSQDSSFVEATSRLAQTEMPRLDNTTSSYFGNGRAEISEISEAPDGLATTSYRHESDEPGSDAGGWISSLSLAGQSSGGNKETRLNTEIQPIPSVPESPESKEAPRSKIKRSPPFGHGKFILQSVTTFAAQHAGLNPNGRGGFERMIKMAMRVFRSTFWSFLRIGRTEGREMTHHDMSRCVLAMAEHRPYNFEKQRGSLLPLFRHVAFYAVLHDPVSPPPSALGLVAENFHDKSPAARFMAKQSSDAIRFIPFRVPHLSVETSSIELARTQNLKKRIQNGEDVCSGTKTREERYQMCLELLDMPNSVTNNSIPMRYLLRSAVILLPSEAGKRETIKVMMKSQDPHSKLLASSDKPKMCFRHLWRYALFGPNDPRVLEVEGQQLEESSVWWKSANKPEKNPKKP